MVTTYVIDPFDDYQIAGMIDAARQDVDWAAWHLVELIERALRERQQSPKLYDYAADFFKALLDAREASADAKLQTAALSGALATLGIVKRQGRPKTDAEVSMILAARLLLLERAGYKRGVALNALASREITDQRLERGDEYRAAIESFGGRLTAKKNAYRAAIELSGGRLGTLPDAELEALAMIDCKALVRALKRKGASLPSTG